MTTPTKQVDKHYESAREHMAGVRAAADWRRDLIDQHLLHGQDPIKDQAEPEPAQGAS